MSRLLSLLTLVVAGTIFNCQAQKPPLKFGDVSMEEMQMTRYDKDSSTITANGFKEK